MPKFKLVALTTPVPGKEAEFQDWYQNTHIPEVLSVHPGMQQAQRYSLVAKMLGESSYQHMAIYELECDNPLGFLEALKSAGARGELTRSDSSNRATTYAAIFEEHDQPVFSATPTGG